MSDWYYANGSVQCGPIPTADIAELIKAGVVRKETQIWRPAYGAEWRTLGDVCSTSSSSFTEERLLSLAFDERRNAPISLNAFGRSDSVNVAKAEEDYYGDDEDSGMVRIGYDTTCIFFSWAILVSLISAIIFVVGNPNDGRVPPSREAIIIAYIVLAYVAITGLIGLRLVRNPLISWYSGGALFISGAGSVDILFKSIGNRMAFEAMIMLLSFVVSPIGGWVIALSRRN